MMQKKIAAGLAVLLVAGTILGGCGESGAAGNDSVSDAAGNEAAALTEAKTTPYGRYPETITYTLAKMTGVNNSNLPEGETYEDNAYTRLIREIINVQNEDVYENYGDTYNVGISTMIATGNIADIMVVDQKTMNAMQKNDQLADLTEVYANCASDRIKDIYASYGEEILQGCTFDGKLMAFPETNISDGPNLLWVRKDWMEKLGLSVPETIDDVKHIALTFAEENPANQEMGNIGLAVSTTLYGGTGISSEYGMNLIFASFGAYPGRWLTDAEGMPVYGSVQPNVKDALGMLADWYQEGVLDRDFLIRTQDDIADLIAQGRCGIFFAPWWAPNNPLWRCHETDPEADWQPFLIRTGKDGSVRYCNEKLTGNYVVVRKGYEYPEIVPKILSVMFDYMRYSYDDPRGEFQQYYTGNIDPTARPLAINLDYNQALTICYENLQAALNGEKSEDELEILERSFEKVCRAYLENPKTASAEEWSAYLSRIKACSLLSDEKIQRVNTIYPTRTKTTEAYRYTLKELESETFLKIIRGESELSSFDDFVKEWQEEGGDEIIQEMIQERKSLSSQEDQKTEEKAEQKAE